MDIIIGGVYQGKLDYAKAQFSLTDSDVFFCSECPVLDLTKRCIYGFEQYLRACAQSSILPQTEYPAETVLICEDIFCGIVDGRFGTQMARFSRSYSHCFSFQSEHGYSYFLRAAAAAETINKTIIKKRISWYYPAGKLPKGGMG